MLPSLPNVTRLVCESHLIFAKYHQDENVIMDGFTVDPFLTERVHGVRTLPGWPPFGFLEVAIRLSRRGGVFHAALPEDMGSTG